MSKPIKPRDAASFSSKYAQSQDALAAMIAPGGGRFMAVRVEEMFRLFRLPIPPNRAYIHTIIFLTSGEANMTIGSEKCTIHENQCLVVPAGQVFSFDKPDVNTGFLCSFQDEFLVEKFSQEAFLKDFGFLRIWGNPVINFSPEQASWMAVLMDRMQTEYAASGIKQAEILQSQLVALLYEINRAYNAENVHFDSPGIKDPGRSARIVHQFRALLTTEISHVHEVAEYARLLHISPNHLNKTVSAVTGKSPVRWITDTLVLEAKVLLGQTNMSVNEIAASLGLFDASYFSRMFKKQTGTTPLAFRKMIEKS